MQSLIRKHPQMRVTLSIQINESDSSAQRGYESLKNAPLGHAANDYVMDAVTAHFPSASSRLALDSTHSLLFCFVLLLIHHLAAAAQFLYTVMLGCFDPDRFSPGSRGEMYQKRGWFFFFIFLRCATS